MNESLTEDLAEKTEIEIETAEEAAFEPLIEEISIDGMCGVY